MIKRIAFGLLALVFAGAAWAQTYQPGRAPGFRPGLQFLAQGAVASLTKLSATDKDPTIVLSADQLTATRTGSTPTFPAVRSTLSKNTGKWYFEFKLNALDPANNGNSFSVGVATAAASTSNFTGAETTSWGIFRGSGQVSNNSTFRSTGADLAPGDVISIALDAAAGNLWFARNGVWVLSGNPATGANPTFSNLGAGTAIFVALSLYATTESVSVNFGGSAFVYTPPSGFSAWG